MFFFTLFNVLQGFLDRMSGPLVQAHCQDYSADASICPLALGVHASPQNAAQTVTQATTTLKILSLTAIFAYSSALF